jgi:hypothetical protein
MQRLLSRWLVADQRTVDLLDKLDRQVRADVPTIDSPQGLRAHPTAVEARQRRRPSLRVARPVAARGGVCGLDGDHRPPIHRTAPGETWEQYHQRVGPLTAVPAGAADPAGTAGAVCGTRVQPAHPSAWPPARAVRDGVCPDCQQRTA